jgi:hypothetical protein
MVLAMVLTSLLSDPVDEVADPPAADAQNGELESREPAVDANQALRKSADAKREHSRQESNLQTADRAVKTKPVDTKPASARPSRTDDKGGDGAGGQAAGDSTRPGRSSSTPRSSSPSGDSIRLSAGTALAQTLPSGTAMGFSVDYRFETGQPDSSATYFWVITPSGLQPVKQPVQLQSEGTLQTFFPDLRPDGGPFETHIETQDGTRLATPLRLR